MTSADPFRRATERVWAELPDGTRRVLVDGLSPTDLQTLLLDVVRSQPGRVGSARLVRRWAQDRFVAPAEADPRRLARLVARAPTNVLAREAARRRRGTREDVHLATHHRVLRAQRFAPGYAAHFGLFALVSSGRDRGSRSSELDFLGRHLRAWRALLEPTLGAGRFGVTYPTGDPYYAGLRFKIGVQTDDGQYEIGDGGLTDWTAQLRADAKERCLVSCVSTERWLGLL